MAHPFEVEKDIVVVGAGPAGLCAAGLIAQESDSSVAILDMGRPFDHRLCPCAQSGKCSAKRNCNVLGGIGGASTIYGAKFCGYPAGSSIEGLVPKERLGLLQVLLVNLIAESSQSLADLVASAFIQDERLYRIKGGLWKPYQAPVLFQADVAQFIQLLVGHCQAAGVSMLHGTLVKHIFPMDGGFKVHCRDVASREVLLLTKKIILATGRAGASWLADSFECLGIGRLPSYVDLGIRVEAPAEAFEDLRPVYGEDPKFKYNTLPYPVRTFCVCAGGELTRVNWNRIQYVDGHFGEKRGPRGNLALMCRLPVSPDQRSDKIALDYARETMRGGSLVAQDFESFLKREEPKDHRSLTLGAAASNLASLIPEPILSSLLSGIEHLIDTAPKILSKSSYVIAPAIDHFWNTYQVDGNFMTDLGGLYLVGDAVGRSRGILQACWTGLACAQSLVSQSSFQRSTAVAATDPSEYGQSV